MCFDVHMYLGTLQNWDMARQQLSGVALSQIVQSSGNPFLLLCQSNQTSPGNRVEAALLDYSVQLPTAMRKITV